MLTARTAALTAAAAAAISAVSLYAPASGAQAATRTQPTTVTFDFPFPCVDSGNPYHVTTTSVPHTTTRTRHGVTTITFLDQGAYTATPDTPGATTRQGRFLDTYRITAVGAVLDESGTVVTARHYRINRLLVLTDRGRPFFRTVSTLNAADYDAATDVPVDDTTCGK